MKSRFFFFTTTLLVILGLPFAGNCAEDAQAPTEALTGSWVRMDGGYVIQINAIAEDGKMDAAYLNPNSIHVESATASLVDGNLRVYLVLQDTNYPGATYRLQYEKQADELTGTYYQPALKQTFDIEFVRKK